MVHVEPDQWEVDEC